MNIRSKNIVISTIKKIFSYFLNKKNNFYIVKIVKFFCNLILIRTWKLRTIFYFQRKDFKVYFKTFKKSKNNILVFLSSKDRLNYLKKTLNLLIEFKEKEKFDLLIFDGSSDINTIKFLEEKEKLYNIPIFYKIEGGPDIPILLAFYFAKKLPYDYYLLIESDILPNKMTISKSLKLINNKYYRVAAVGGLNLRKKIIRLKRNYSLSIHTTAAYFLWKKQISSLLYDNYRLTDADEIYKNILKKFNNIEKNTFENLKSIYFGKQNYLYSPDWNFFNVLINNNYHYLVSRPSIVIDLDHDKNFFQDEIL